MILLAFTLFGFFNSASAFEMDEHHHEESFYDAEFGDYGDPFRCLKANSSQLAVVNEGNSKYEFFLNGCMNATGNSPWCHQLTRPNPASISTFYCTYGSSQVHRMIHPAESTWEYAYKAVSLIQRLEAKGIEVEEIYNWWRPEPYNENVGGAPGRHPYGTSVDVRFATKQDMENAHKLLCEWRSQGEMRALGYYGSTGLHLGIGDKVANTWGKGCDY